MRTARRGVQLFGLALVAVACHRPEPLPDAAAAPGGAPPVSRPPAISVSEPEALEEPAPGSPTAATPVRLLPVDEAAAHPEFFVFRAALQRSLAARDPVAVLAALDPGIRTSFGGDGGIAEFRDTWRPEDPDSPLWEELAGILALGGRFGGESLFSAPYVYAAWPEGVDAFTHVALMGAAVAIHGAADATAPVLARFDHALLSLDESREEPPSGWVAVRLPDGGRGFVAATDVRSPVSWRAIFHRGEDGWRLGALVAGD